MSGLRAKSARAEIDFLNASAKICSSVKMTGTQRCEMEMFIRKTRPRETGLRIQLSEHSSGEGNYLWRRFVFALAVLIPLLPAASLAETWWWGSPVSPGYDRSSVIEITGVVSQIHRVQRGGGSSLTLSSDDAVFIVMLGPGWYLRRERADIQIGDKISVRGSRMETREGKVYLVAAKATNMRTGQVLRFRDDYGRPLWSSKSGSGRQRSPVERP